MATRISRTEEERKAEAKIVKSERHREFVKMLNEYTKKLKRDFLFKQSKSWQSASTLILNS